LNSSAIFSRSSLLLFMIYFSICSRKDKQPKSLQKLINYSNQNEFTDIKVSYDSTSIYDGHKQNIEFFKESKILEDDDIIIMCHDDIDIISQPEELLKYLSLARKPGVGFLGLAGACHLADGAWWNARKTGEARGFVFQGTDKTTMVPNYFGRSGQVLVLDGCFLAATYKTIKNVGMDEPAYLETGWDFYDIHLTYKAYLDGFANYTVPIIAMHESSGQMREGWYNARKKFMNHHVSTLPYAKLMIDKTNGLPQWNI